MINLHILMPIASHKSPSTERSIATLEREKYRISVIEVIGYSEVARARNHVATAAAERVELNDLVFWLDSDIVINPRTFDRHVDLVMASRRFYPDGLAISGRYVNRRVTNRIAASHDEFEDRMPIHIDDKGVTLLPMMVGMGCLMMTGGLFLGQLNSSPKGMRWLPDGRSLAENLVCCPRLIEDVHATKRSGSKQFAMLSEDFDYCSRIPSGAWMPRFDDGSSLDYGHVITQVAMPSGPVEIVDDRG